MARKDIFRYFVNIRLTAKSDHKNSLHINACSRAGAIYQAIMLVKKYKIEDIHCITVRSKAYPLALRKRKRYLKSIGRVTTCKRSNDKSLKLIKSRLEGLNKPSGDSV
jgi:hypothetical protein